MSVENTIDSIIKFYSFYKVELPGTSSGSSQRVGDCPFCLDPEHFFVCVEPQNAKQFPGGYSCKKCGVSGNKVSFITALHNQLLEATTEEHYESLSAIRKLPKEVFKLARFAYSEDYGLWYVPYQNGSDFLSNLGAFNPHAKLAKNRFRIYKGPGLEIKLYRPFNTKQVTSDVWAFEGEWDLLAAYAAHRAQKVKPPAMIALPGATTWKPEWNSILEGTTVTFFFDNDKGGEDGKKSIEKKAKGFSYSFASWDTEGISSLPEGWGKDIRDVWNAIKIKRKVLPILVDMSANVEVVEVKATTASEGGFTTNVEDIPMIDSHSTMTEQVKSCLYTNTSILQSLDAIFASCISVNLPGEPLWIFLVGPPSSGKSGIIAGFGGINKYFDYASKFTAESLVSGWRGEGGEDSSTLPAIDKKTMFIKDLTVLLGLPREVQQKVWDLLRDAYDGYLKIIYGNGVVRQYTDFKFNIIAGVTHAIHRHNDATMGERFLKIDFLGNNFDEDAHMDAAFANVDAKNESKDILMKAILGYYRYLAEGFTPEKILPLPPEIQSKIKSLAKLVSRLRTKVEKDRHEGMLYRPVSEVATRLALQLQTMLRCLCYIRQDYEHTQETYNIVRKVAFDSCHELSFEVIEYMFNRGSATRKELVRDLQIPGTRVHQITNDFMQLGVIVNTPPGKKVVGRTSHSYYLNEEITECLTSVKSRIASPSLRKRTKKK